MFFKVVLLGLVAFVALTQASYYPSYGPSEYLGKQNKESTDETYAINTDKTQDADWGKSRTKKIGFANQQRSDESAKTDDVTLKQGPSYGGYGGYVGYGGYGGHGGYGKRYRPGYGLPYQGGLEYSSSKKDIRKSADGSTKYDAVDDAREHDKRAAADRGKIYVDRHGRKGSSVVAALTPGYAPAPRPYYSEGY